MKPRRLPALSYLLAAFLCACASPDNAEPPTPLGEFTPSARVVEPWRARISSQVNLFSFSFVPHIDGDTIYATDHKGQLSALSRETGQLLWRKNLQENITAGIAADAKRLFLGTLDGHLLALSKANGDELWRAAMSTEIIALPDAADDMVTARSIDGRIVLFNANDGQEKWRYTHRVPALTVRGNGRALIVPGGVLAGLGNGKLLALNIADGNPLWEVTLSEPSGRSEIERLNDVDATLQLDNGSIFAAGFQGQLARISPRKGRILWAREMSTIAGFRLHDDVLYVTDSDSNVWALDRENGESLWKQDKLRARQLTAPVPVGDYLLVADLEGYLHWLSRYDGHLVARRHIDKGRILTAAAIDDDTAFVQSEFGLLVAVRAVVDDIKSE